MSTAQPDPSSVPLEDATVAEGSAPDAPAKAAEPAAEALAGPGAAEEAVAASLPAVIPGQEAQTERPSLWRRITLRGARTNGAAQAGRGTNDRLATIERVVTRIETANEQRAARLEEQLTQLWEIEEQLSQLAELTDHLSEVRDIQHQLAAEVQAQGRRTLWLAAIVALGLAAVAAAIFAPSLLA